MNLLEGRVQGGTTEVCGARLPVPEAFDFQDGQRITYGIRPEHLRVGEGGISGVVAVVEPTGSETHVVVRAGKRDVVAVFRERVGFRPGNTLSLVPEVGSVHVFDADSGQRLG
ncbi:MAG: TOBE domain-containing protein [Tabrizicola sp.]|nr:TOBE domain-containing protein [Tabrizicola sp.]